MQTNTVGELLSAPDVATSTVCSATATACDAACDKHGVQCDSWMDGSALLASREKQTKRHLDLHLIMSRAKQPAVHNAFDSDISSPPNSPRLAPVKARTKNRNANASASNNVRALPLQPSVIANTPKKRRHEEDDQKDAPKPKKTRKNDDKPLQSVSLSCPPAVPFLALPAYLFHIVAYRS